MGSRGIVFRNLQLICYPLYYKADNRLRVQSVHVLEGPDRIRQEIKEAVENGAVYIPMYVCYLGNKCIAPEYV